MDISFTYARDRQYYAIGFLAGAFETAPFVPELRFWGVDRYPCPRLSALAALIALKTHPLTSVTLKSVDINAPVCSVLSQHLGVEIHASKYNADRRDLPGGELVVLPARFGNAAPPRTAAEGAELLTWISLNDLGGLLGGAVRTNIDVFDLTEAEKNLILALCCSGKELGHVLLDRVDPELADVMHGIGLELAEA